MNNPNVLLGGISVSTAQRERLEAMTRMVEEELEDV
jgi:hypothetical protein